MRVTVAGEGAAVALPRDHSVVRSNDVRVKAHERSTGDAGCALLDSVGAMANGAGESIRLDVAFVLRPTGSRKQLSQVVALRTKGVR